MAILPRMKDYYAILECTPLSSADDIKKKYRKLAQQFHPDKKPNDPYAAAIFQDLKEAYETLTQPTRKEAWLNERWLHQVHHTFQAQAFPLTPDRILKNVLKLDREFSMVDAYRMDQFTAVKDLENVMNDENLNCLKNFDEKEINQTIILHMLACTKPFSYPYLENLWEKLLKLAGDNVTQVEQIEKVKQQKRNRHLQQKLTVPLALIITILLCLMIKKFAI